MSSVRGLHHTGYTVADLERSLHFYRDLLGMVVVAEQEKDGGYLAAIVGYPDAHVRMAHLRFPGGQHMLELFQYLSPRGSTDHAIEPRDSGSQHLCFEVEDLVALYERLIQAGVSSFFSPPIEVDTGVNKGGFGLYLRDPDGIPVELFQPPRR
jgi:catechol 2,3-dioxygenase-like lactoylglutathione lyase family enzyme